MCQDEPHPAAAKGSDELQIWSTAGDAKADIRSLVHKGLSDAVSG